MSVKATFELHPYQVQQMIRLSAADYGREKALQEELSKVYTVEELAAKMSVHPETVYTWIKENRIRYTSTGNKKGYRISELARREFMGDAIVTSVGVASLAEEEHQLKKVG